MKVEELIELLQEADPDADVVVFADHHGHYEAWNTWEGTGVNDNSELHMFDLTDKDDKEYFEEYEYDQMSPFKAFIIAG